MNPLPISLKKIHCSGHSLFGRKGVFLKWHIEPGETFLRGTPLFEYESPSVLTRLTSSPYTRKTYTGAQPGVLVSTNTGGGSRFSERDILGTYVPANQWRGFSRILERHEKAVKLYRKKGRFLPNREGPKELLKKYRNCRNETKVLAEKIRLSEQEIVTLWRETEDALRLCSELRDNTESARLRLIKGLDALSDSDLVTAISERLNTAYDPTDRVSPLSVTNIVSRLDDAICSFLESRFPVPPDDLVLIRTQLKIFQEIAGVFDGFDRQVSAITRDGSLDETTRSASLRKQHQLLRKYCNSVLKPSANNTSEAA